MLLQKIFFEEHIRELQRTSHRDPVLLERAIHAFGLLEALVEFIPHPSKKGNIINLKH